MKTPTFKNKSNTPHETIDGKTIWASRSVCVCIKVCLRLINQPFTLIIKRGVAVSNTGKWCLPCGYIDYNETIKEAAVRELYEETGIVVDIEDLEQYEVMDEPSRDSLENITFHYKVFLDDNPFKILDDVNKFIDEGNTNNESTKAALVSNGTYDEYDYAFNHSLRAKPE